MKSPGNDSWSRRLRLALGLCDLRSECIRHVKTTMDDECAVEFADLYDKIGQGTPVSFAEAATTIDIVEAVKKQLRERNIWHRLKTWCDTQTE